MAQFAHDRSLTPGRGREAKEEEEAEDDDKQVALHSRLAQVCAYVPTTKRH